MEPISDAEGQKPSWQWVLGYALLILGFCLLLYYYREAYQAFRDLVRFFSSRTRISAFVASFGAYAPFAFVAMQVLQVLAAPIPGEFTGFIGGYLFGTGLGFLYSTIGLTLGSWLAFLTARKFGFSVVRRFVGKETMDKFDYLMEHQGAFFSFLFFIIPGLPKDYFCYLLGLSPMRVLTFLVVSTVGRIPGTLMLSMQGEAVRSEDYRAFFVFLGLCLIAIVSALVYRDRIEAWLHRRRRKKEPPPVPPSP